MKGRDFLWEQLDLPGETIPGEPLIEISGCSRVLIENHRGVCEYSRERIGVKVKYGSILVCGSCLELRYMTKQQLIVSGRISGVSLLHREGA